MATDNPKISVYVPPSLHSLLIEFQKSGGAKSLSNAVVEILRIHFNVDSLSSHTSNAPDSVLVEQLHKVSSQIEELVESQSQMRSQLQEIQPLVSKVSEIEQQINDIKIRLNNLEELTTSTSSTDLNEELAQDITQSIAELKIGFSELQRVIEVKNRIDELQRVTEIPKQGKTQKKPLQQKLFENDDIAVNQPLSEADLVEQPLSVISKEQVTNISNDLGIKNTKELLQLLTEVDPSYNWNDRKLRTIRTSKKKLLPMTVKNLVINWVGKEEGNPTIASHLWSVRQLKAKTPDGSSDQNLLDSE